MLSCGGPGTEGEFDTPAFGEGGAN